jgi:uncharacterized protein (DUF4415 family)
MQDHDVKTMEPDWDDNPEWTPETVKVARPVREAHPDLAEWSEKRKRGQRGPQKTPTKEPVTLRLDPEVLDAYKATGPGYQTRMAEVLRNGIQKKKPSMATQAGSSTLTPREVASILHVAERSVITMAATWVESGGKEGIPGFKIGKSWRFDPAKLQQWLNTKGLFKENRAVTDLLRKAQ